MPEPLSAEVRGRNLANLVPGEMAIVRDLQFAEKDAVRLMELGFIPGTTISCHRRVPMGDLRVYQVDGSQIAIRRETAERILLESAPEQRNEDADSD